MKKNQESIKQEREMIFEMIDASWELAQQLGEHPLKPGCNCISCVNKRKRILEKQESPLCQYICRLYFKGCV